LLLLLAGLFLRVSAWDGGARVQCRFHIVDSWTGNPIQHAKIRVVHDSLLEWISRTNSQVTLPFVTTDRDGKAIALVSCGAGGGRTFLRKTGAIVVSHQLFVEADGYFPVSVALENIVGRKEWPLSKKEFEIELILFERP
jgi:hypothetical protein